MALIEAPVVLQLLPQPLRHGDWRSAVSLATAAVVAMLAGIALAARLA